eukprot:scaffold84814_cov36-Phaeocystis_antarctica.AAC.1
MPPPPLPASAPMPPPSPPPPSPSLPPPPSPKPPCATPIDFALVLDESYFSYSMNRKDGPNFINGPNGTKAFAKELVRHAALKPRSPPTTAHEPEPEPEPGPEPEPEPEHP